MATASVYAKSAGREECYIYIDNSNLWIEGQRYAAGKQKMVVPLDPRFRIDIGNLIKKILGNRRQAYAVLYGSEPPALDTVWKAIERKQIELKIFSRNSKGSEKEIDTSLCTDAIKMACKKSGSSKGVFVIIAGDRDYKPCIEGIMEEKFDVEIYAWKKGLANSLVEMAKRNRSLKIICLETLVSEMKPAETPWIYYRYEWNKEKQIPRDRSIVHSFSDRGDCDLIELIKAATKLFKLPCQGCWYGSTANAIITVMPAETSEATTNGATANTTTFDFTTLFNRWKMSDALKKFQCNEEPISATKYFAPQVENVCMVEGRVDDETADGDGAFQVVPSTKSKPKKLSSSEPCQYNFACNKVGRCGRQHTEAERRYFQRHGRAARGYKSKICYHNQHGVCNFKNDTVLCPYAHNIAEARCYNCYNVGHFACDCQQERHWA